jgi:drug/metabolite transporter (DMT)-like permease
VFLLGAQVYRYVRVSGPVERRQTKWVLVGFACLAAAGALILGTGQTTANDQLTPTGQLIAALGNLPLFAALAIAASRYRLWEIDRLLSRAVSYGIVTVLLGGTYALVVVGLAALLGRDGDGLAVAAATLVVAAAFGPVRRRVQDRVDRRFDRRRYDAVRTVQTFTGRLRQEVDLDVLAGELLGVVRSTTQPTHASLWLRARP